MQQHTLVSACAAVSDRAPRPDLAATSPTLDRGPGSCPAAWISCGPWPSSCSPTRRSEPGGAR